MDENKEIIAEILSCAVESSKQEMSRSNILLAKSDYLMKYISATFVIVNAVCAFAISREFIPAAIVCVYYLLIGILLLISMVITIQVQTLLKVEYFPTGTQILEGMAERWESDKEVYSILNLQVDNIKYYSQYTESLKEANDDRAKKLKQAYKCFVYATVGVAIGFLIFLILIA